MRYKPCETLLLRYLGSGPVLRIIDFFLDNPLSEYSKEEVARNLGMSKQTMHRYFGILEEMDMVKVNRTTNKTRFYKVNRSSPMIRTITEFERKLSMQIAEREEAKMKRPVADM